jgi:uncharacterized protein (DUF58 family)
MPGRLLVREHEDPRIRDAVVILDTHVPRAAESRRRARLERAVRFAATLADALLAEGYKVRFQAYTPELVSVDLDPRARDLDLLLQELALLRPTRTRPVSELLASQDAGRDQTVFLLRIGDDALPPVENLGHVVTLTSADMRSLMDEPGIPEGDPE